MITKVFQMGIFQFRVAQNINIWATHLVGSTENRLTMGNNLSRNNFTNCNPRARIENRINIYIISDFSVNTGLIGRVCSVPQITSLTGSSASQTWTLRVHFIFIQQTQKIWSMIAQLEGWMLNARIILLQHCVEHFSTFQHDKLLC